MNEPKEPIQTLEVILTDSNALAVQDADKALLIATLRPIAQGIALAEQYASAVVVTSKEQADAAVLQRDKILSDAETAETAINNYGKDAAGNGMINRLFAMHRRWTAHRGAIVDPLKAAAKTVKGKIITYQEAEAEKARQETARLQAIEDERARKEQERLTKAAEKLKTPELKQERLEAAAAIVPVVVRVAAPMISVRSQKRWKVTSVDLGAFVIAASKDPLLLGYLTLETGKLERTKASNAMFQASGIVFSHVSI